MCIREFKQGPGLTDDFLQGTNRIHANMDSRCNLKSGKAWLYQNSFNMAVRMELRRRKLPVEPVSGIPFALRKGVKS